MDETFGGHSSVRLANAVELSNQIIGTLSSSILNEVRKNLDWENNSR